MGPDAVEGVPDGVGAAAFVGEVVGIDRGLLLPTVARVGDSMVDAAFVEERAAGHTTCSGSSQSSSGGALLMGMPIPIARETPGVSQEVDIVKEALASTPLHLTISSVGQGCSTRIDVLGEETGGNRPGRMGVGDGVDLHSEGFKVKLLKILDLTLITGSTDDVYTYLLKSSLLTPIS